MAKLNSFSTAIEALRGMDLSGKIALVTGGNNGIGVETVRALAVGGAKVYLTSRSVEKGEKVASDIMEKKVKGSVHVLKLDLTDFQSIHSVSNEIMSKEQNLHYLICNAGCVSQKQYTKYGFEMTMATNHYGHFALVSDLMDFMVKQDVPARIVVVASDGYMAGSINLKDLNYRQTYLYASGKAYCDSKLANVLYSKALAKKLEDTKVRVFALQPGGIFTNLPASMVGQANYDMFKSYVPLSQLEYIGSILTRGEWKNLEQGAATSVYAATAPELDPYTGAYLRNCSLSDVFWFAKDMKKAESLYDITEQQIKEAEAKYKPQ